jgi:pSer/pThr/pTyr-binding forkhead associated (FHA) protein
MSDETRALAGALLALAAGDEPARAGPHLLVQEPGEAERVVPLLEELLIGRGRQASVRLRDPAASRRHARIRRSPEGLAEVVDLGSKNGLRLGGRRLRAGPARLASGDVVAIGAARVAYVDPLARVGEAALEPPEVEAPHQVVEATPREGPGSASAALLLTCGGLLLLVAGLLLAG